MEKQIVRKPTREVQIGSRRIGGKNPILIQSMTNTHTEDIKGTIAQIQQLTSAGCEIIRCAVPTMEAAEALAEIKKGITIPLVADIHFDYRLAIAAIENGADKIRINPGNIGGVDKAKYLADYLKERGVALRIGVNGGSLDNAHKSKPLAQAMRDSALEYVSVLEKCNFYDIVISAKSSNVKVMLDTYRLLDKACDYPCRRADGKSRQPYEPGCDGAFKGYEPKAWADDRNDYA